MDGPFDHPTPTSPPFHQLRLEAYPLVGFTVAAKIRPICFVIKCLYSLISYLRHFFLLTQYKNSFLKYIIFNIDNKELQDNRLKQ